MTFVQRFFAKKLLTFLHDPPDKCWHVTRKLPGGHAEVAGWICQQLGLSGLEWAEPTVRAADSFSAAVDRWITLFLERAVGKKVEVDEVQLINLLSGEAVFPDCPGESKPEKWVTELQRLKAIVKETLGEEWIRYFYHLVYAFAEPLYIKLYPRSLGPADTRVPYHTVFDHLAMACSVANWMMDEEREVEARGLLVMLDLAGVMEYIGQAKKMSDLSFGSLLVSSIAWYLVEELVDKVGPDILFLPTCRWNPYYYRWLLAKLREKKVKVDELENLLSSFRTPAGDPLLSLKEMHALLTSVMTLFLPPPDVLSQLVGTRDWTPEGIANYFKERYENFLQELVASERHAVEKDEHLRELLENVRLYNYPPLPLRVCVVELPSREEIKGEEIDELVKLIGICKEEEERSLINLVLYLKVWKTLEETFQQLKNLKLRDFLSTEDHEFTVESYNSDVSFEYCTVCSRLPATLILPRGEEYRLRVPEKYRSFFDEGERLCAKCLTKRLALTVARKTITGLLGRGFEGVTIYQVGPLAWYISYPFFLALTHVEEGKKEIEQEWKTFQSEIQLMGRKEEGLVVAKHLITTNEEIVEELLEKYPESGFPELFKETFGRSIPLSRYYALLQADADSFGKLIRCNFKEAIGRDLVEIFGEMVTKVLPSITEEQKREFSNKLEGFIRLLKEKFNLELLLPSFQSTLSRTMMLLAQRDSSLLKRRFGHGADLIYAGGDDLLAVSSLIGMDENGWFTLLDFLRENRSMFSKGDQNTFIKILDENGELAYFPAMGQASRSYSIILAHYKSHLARVLEDARKGVEKAKENCTRWKKDSVYIECQKRGGGRRDQIILPLGVDNPVLKNSEVIINDILTEKLSRSLIYDLDNFSVAYEGTRVTREPDLYKKLLLHTIMRNIELGAPERSKDEKKFENILEELDQWTKEKQLDKNAIFLLSRVLLAMDVAVRGGE